MRRLLIAITLFATACAALSAQPRRSMSVLLEKAATLLGDESHGGQLRQLDAIGSCCVVGRADRGFVVMSTDEALPLVLGMSASAYDPANKNFLWWLRAVASLSPTAQHAPATPQSLGYADSVAPMLTTRWQQEYPYNQLCPTGGGGQHCLTGCVATAMAQILAHHRAPRHGQGWRTIYYPSNNTAGQPVRAVFEDHYYDWDNMVADCTVPGVGETQRLAVATLMRDCGVACNMMYGTESSGSTLVEAADGLRTYFGIATAQHAARNKSSEEEWMRQVYDELSHGHPILYGGMDPNPMTGISGHAFVLHGYDKQGRVYVNWGWGGQNDGFYDISLLNPANMKFSTQQDMVVGIVPRAFTTKEIKIQNVEPGTLDQRLSEEQAADVTTLTIGGTLGPADFATLRQRFAHEGSLLEVLDLSQTRLADDELPPLALSGCASLRRLCLPAIGTWGDGAVAGCRQLRQTELTTDDMPSRAYIYFDNAIWTPDTTALIELLPAAEGQVQLPKGVKSLHHDALAGCVRVSSLSLPASTATIGDRALSQLRDLCELRTTAHTLPTLGADALQGLDYEHCRLYVLRGMKAQAAATEGWSAFATATYDNIVEFGTTIKARNAVRPEGQPNPELGYQVIGDYVEGTPLLVCDATPQSPPGRYTIHVLPGSISSEAVDYVDGYLIVTAADAISSIERDAQPAQRICDLQGRRLSGQPRQSGLYIIDGRKTIIH